MTVDDMSQSRSAEAIQAILEARAAALAKVDAEAESSEDGRGVMVFRVGGTDYGVPIDQILEIQPLQDRTWCRVPCTPKFVLGAVNIRGMIYSILNLGTYLGSGESEITKSSHVLLVKAVREQGGEPMELCLLADELPATRRIPAGEIRSSRGAVSARAESFVEGVTPDMVVVVNLGRLLSDPQIVVNEEP